MCYYLNVHLQGQRVKNLNYCILFTIGPYLLRNMWLERAAGPAMVVPWGQRVTCVLFDHNGSRNQNIMEAGDCKA